MKALSTLVAVAFLAVTLACSADVVQPAADLIVTGARVWTVNPAQPEAEAVAVLGERIIAVGSAADVNAWRGPRTRVIDAGGRRVVPGFNDAHVHFIWGGQQLENVDLRDAPSQAEFAARIARHAAKLPLGEWVTGGSWDDQRWSPAVLPAKELIDAATPERPVFVRRYDGHMGLANSAALRLAGITAKTVDPPGGLILRNAAGEPTGILKDAAMPLVERAIPPLTEAQRLRFARRALEHAAGLGVTSVQYMNCTFTEFAVLARLAERGELTTRVYAAPMETSWQDLAKIGVRRGFGSAFLRTGALKGYADGSLGSSTAYFFEPYADDPANSGLLSDEMQPTTGMLERLTRADAAGLQLCIHGIGDRAISEVLDLFAQVERTNGAGDRRFRIEHSQHVAPKDFARYKALGVIASVQPYHAIDDGRWAEPRIGPERAKTTYAFRTFLDCGVRLALGTDWPVAPLDPLATIYAATTRATLDGRRNAGWVPEQKITVAESVAAYTLGSAYAEFQDAQKGSLEPGKLADLVILSGDIFSMPPQDIRDVKVDLTIVGGRVVWDRAKGQ
ncbi:MAG: amidohydrolase [Pirellulales bacterium]